MSETEELLKRLGMEGMGKYWKREGDRATLKLPNIDFAELAPKAYGYAALVLLKPGEHLVFRSSETIFGKGHPIDGTWVGKYNIVRLEVVE